MQQHPLLQTKLYIPPTRPELVSRPRLLERLNEGLYRKLTLISAPAGFGKTTLVSEWVQAMGTIAAMGGATPPIAAAWLSLDKGDNDPTRFLAYLVAALQTTAANIGEGVLAVLQSPSLLPAEAVLIPLINEIANIPDRTLLVLDDYHLVDAQPIHEAIGFLIENTPPQMHLVIASREDPPLPLPLLRARDQVTELRAADLRFSPSEAAEFLNQVMGLDLSAEDIAALETRTEGWIAGLQLAALALQGTISLQGHIDASRLIQSFTGSHRLVLDCLIEEVLEKQPEDIQNFLLQTAILDRLCGPLCDAVCSGGTASSSFGTAVLSAPSASGQETLEYLEQANMLVVPLDNERQWYRYHHLFAEVLQARSMEQQPNRLAILHRRASEWYEHYGLPADAIRHAFAAEDFERAADLAELAWPAWSGSFQSITWLGWVKALPEELVRARPVLCVALAQALLGAGKLEAAEARLLDAERWLEPTTDMSDQLEAPSQKMVVVDEEQFRSLPASLAIARTYHAQATGDLPGTLKYTQRSLDLFPEGNHLRRGLTTVLLGLAYWASGDLEEAHRAVSDGRAEVQRAGHVLDTISAAFVLAAIEKTLGHLHEAVRTCEQSLQLAIEHGEPMPLGTEEVYTAISELHRERDDLEAAAQDLATSKKLGEQVELPDWQHRWCTAQARLKETLGDLDGALDLLDEAERLHVRSPVPDARPIAALKTRVWVAQGRLAEALGWVRERGLSVDDDLSYMGEFEHITLVRVIIGKYRSDLVDGSIHEAVGLLERLLQAAEEGGRTGSVIEILVLQALAYEAQGNIPPALLSLERALTLAEPEGYLRLFVDEGPSMGRLLYEALSQGIAPNYVRRLLATFPVDEPEQTVLSKHQTQESERIEPLSERETEVLQLIAEGLTNQEIATRLYLSPNTVKVHTRNIYSKLDAHHRAAAVARARALGILPST